MPFTTRNHIRGHARAGEDRRASNFRTSKRGINKSFPPPAIAKLLVVSALTSHGAKIERTALVQEFGSFRGSYLEALQGVPDSRSVFHVQRSDVVVALAQHIEAAF